MRFSKTMANALALLALLASAAIATPALAAEGLNLTPDVPKLLINMGVFALLIYPTHKLLLQPLVGVLLAREAATAGSVEKASGLRDSAAGEREQLDAALAETRHAAAARRNEILAEAQSEERSILDAARSDAGQVVAEVRDAIAGELEQARRSLQDDARELAGEAAARILGRNP